MSVTSISSEIKIPITKEIIIAMWLKYAIVSANPTNTLITTILMTILLSTKEMHFDISSFFIAIFPTMYPTKEFNTLTMNANDIDITVE